MSAYPSRFGAPADDPNRTLGIVGLVLAIVASVVGLVISIVALRRSRRDGFRGRPAFAGVVVGVITTIGTIIAVIGIILAARLGNQITQQCQGHPDQPVVINGQSVRCPATS